MKTNRRQFLTTIGLTTAGFAAGLPAWALEKKTDRLGQIGFISGIVDNFLKEDWKGTLEKLAKQGYTEMESGNYLGNSLEEFKSVCKSLGINPFAGGSSMAGMLKEPEKQIAEALEVAHDKGIITDAQLQGADRGSGSLADGGLGLITDVRAGINFHLTSRDLHGKCQTGGDAAFAAVLLRQHLENLNTG